MCCLVLTFSALQIVNAGFSYGFQPLSPSEQKQDAIFHILVLYSFNLENNNNSFKDFSQYQVGLLVNIFEDERVCDLGVMGGLLTWAEESFRSGGSYNAFHPHLRIYVKRS